MCDAVTHQWGGIDLELAADLQDKTDKIFEFIRKFSINYIDKLNITVYSIN